MAALKALRNTPQTAYINISDGKFVQSVDGEKQTFNELGGTITGVTFETCEFEGRTYERAKFSMSFEEEEFILCVRTQSGYFRSLCNCLKSGNPLAPLTLKATSQTDKDGKTKCSILVKQNGAWLRHAYTQSNPGDLPQLEKIRFNGRDEYDGTKQLEFWKNWLMCIDFSQSILSGPATDIPEEPRGHIGSEEKIRIVHVNDKVTSFDENGDEIAKDLPF